MQIDQLVFVCVHWNCVLCPWESVLIFDGERAPLPADPAAAIESLMPRPAGAESSLTAAALEELGSCD